MGGRPKEGYRNSAGEKIPGTHDPISRFKQSDGLIHWAYGRGKKGLPLYDQGVLNIGSAVHAMADLDLKGRPDREIEKCAHDFLAAPDHLQMAWSCFREFRQWREQCHVRAIAQEKPLVSERWQFGGTPDAIVMFGNGGRGIIDPKTSAKVYSDHWLAIRAHGELWEENYPDLPLDAGYHVLIFPKDGGKFQHHVKERDELETEWRIYTLLLEAYRLEKEPSFAKASEGKRAPKKPVTPREKLAPRIEPSPRFQTMGELLRAWHVKEGVPA